MKKITLVFALLLTLCGCAAQNLALDPETITQINITTLTGGEDLTRTYTDDKKISAICSYLNSLNLISRFTEKIDQTEGQTYVLTIYDDNEEPTVIYHFGNVFIKRNDEDWKKISYKQGSELYSLLLKYESDEQ